MSDRKRKPGKNGRLSRRQFIGGAASAAAAIAAAPARGAAKKLGANDRIGIGVIGTGGRGNSHINVIHHLKKSGMNVDVTAVCDVYRPRLNKAAAKCKAKAYMDHRELLADPNVDVVSIATPDHHHGFQAIDAVKAGKDVYCEKPVTHWRQFELTKRLAAEVKKSGRVFQLGTQAMSDGAWHKMKKLVKDGLIGRPLMAECGYFRVGDWGERGMRIDDRNAKPGPDLNWEAFLGDSPKRKFDVSRFFRWRMYEDYAGGPVTDLYPHSFTPIASILDIKMPSTVVATGGKFRYQEREVPDTFNMLVDYPQKFTVVILGTQGNNYCATGMRGAAGRIPVIRGWDGSLTIERKHNKIAFIPAQGSKKKPQTFDIEYGENFVNYYKHFLDCCRAGKKDTYSPADLAYYAQTALIMGVLAHREGKIAKFDADREKIIL